jgi:hypothetical protein
MLHCHRLCYFDIALTYVYITAPKCYLLPVITTPASRSFCPVPTIDQVQSLRPSELAAPQPSRTVPRTCLQPVALAISSTISSTNRGTITDVARSGQERAREGRVCPSRILDRNSVRHLTHSTCRDVIKATTMQSPLSQSSNITTYVLPIVH